MQERLCFTATLTSSYEQAALLASKWGVPADASSVHALVQRLGARAVAQTAQRLRQAPREREPQRVASRLGILELDGWLVRHRGPGWGRKRSKQARTEWREMKMGVYYQMEQAVGKDHGRAQLFDKVIVSTLARPLELGRHLHWEALRAGLGRAKTLELVADGAAWIWRLKQHRWEQAVEVLDFYHASEHAWALGRGLKGEAQAASWVEPLLHQLRHGQEKKALRKIAGLPKARGDKGRIIRREQHYFAAQAHRMNYQEIAAKGWPIGSGAVESACRQRQCRFKRPGQLWTAKGLRHLCALEEARHNHHWDQLWSLIP